MNKEEKYSMCKENEISILSRQLKEIQSTISGLQSLISNGDFAISQEIKELKNEQLEIAHKLDKLIGDKTLVNDEQKLKNSFKDYSDKEIYELRKRTSISKAAEILGCSKSTVQRKCRDYLFSDMNIGD